MKWEYALPAMYYMKYGVLIKKNPIVIWAQVVSECA